MHTILILGFFTGLDNLEVTSALGVTHIDARTKWRLALAFAFWEMVMPLIGLLIGQPLHQRYGTQLNAVGPAVMLACGLLILLMALRKRDVSKLAANPVFLFGLPFWLSFDNLFAGIALGSTGYPLLLSAALVGSISASMCFIGMYLGSWIGRWIPGRSEWAAGGVLALLGLVKLFYDAD